MDSPLISVVMPVFNAARTVGRAIESVLGQAEGRFELIAVDDGCRPWRSGRPAKGSS